MPATPTPASVWSERECAASQQTPDARPLPHHHAGERQHRNEPKLGETAGNRAIDVANDPPGGEEMKSAQRYA